MSGYDYGYDGGGGGYGGGYGGGGGFGGPDPMGGMGMGGGFMPESGMGGGAEAGGGSAKKQGRGGSQKEKMTVTPMTIRQILEAQEKDGTALNEKGDEIYQVHLVGCVYSEAEDKSTHILFHVEDGTGRIIVKVQVDDSAVQQQRYTSIVPGYYVAVTGQIFSWNGQKSINCHDIRIVSDFNAVTLHFLDCIYAHLYATKGPLDKPGGGQSLARPTPGGGGGLMGGMGGGASMFGQGQQQFQVGGELTSLQNAVVEACREDDSGTGFTSHEIFQKVQHTGGSMDDVQGAIRYLNDEGHLYTTIDDDHFRSTS